jgi:hypothetical protein
MLFDKLVILFKQVIQSRTMSELTDFGKYSVMLEDVEGQWVGSVFIHGDDARKRREARFQYLVDLWWSRVDTAWSLVSAHQPFLQQSLLR